MKGRKLSDDDCLALVLGGLKGEVPIADLCRRYGVSETTHYKLRDRFMAAGTEGVAQLRAHQADQVVARPDSGVGAGSWAQVVGSGAAKKRQNSFRL